MKASVCCCFQGDLGLEGKQVVNIAMQQSVMNSYKLFGEHDDQIAFLVVDLLHFIPTAVFCILNSFAINLCVPSSGNFLSPP